MVHGIDRIRLIAYFAVAVAGLLAGMILGRLSVVVRPEYAPQRPPVPHPRSLDR